MARLAPALEGLFALFLHVLDRTGALARLGAFRLPVDPADRPLAALLAATSAVLLLHAALASGRDLRVRAFRAGALIGALALPLAALRLAGTARAPALGGAALVLAALSSVAHRVLSELRSEGTASLLLRRARLVLQAGGLALLGAALALLATDRSVPVRLAFWSLFLLRLSIADLIDPSRLASGTGLTQSAARDVRAALGKGSRPPRPARRLRRAATGTLKAALLALWLALPLAAALARGEVAAGAWPVEALHLRWYPAAALALTALLLLAQAGRALRDRRLLEAARGAAVGAGTATWLWLAFRDPAFEAYANALPGLVLAETLAGFLLGAVGRRR